MTSSRPRTEKSRKGATLQIRLARADRQALDAYCRKHDVTVSVLARWWVRDLLAGAWVPQPVTGTRKTR